MRIEVARNQLARLLAQVSKVVESRNTIPVLSCVLIEFKDSVLTATGSDLDIEVTGSIEAEGDSWSGCLNARTLEGIVGKLSGNYVTIEPDGTNVTVKAGRSRFKLGALPAEDFPRLAAGDMPEPFKADLHHIAERCGFAMSNEEARYYLNGIYLEPRAATATDGHRLAHIDHDLRQEFESAILPRKLVGMLPKGEVNVSVTPNKIRVASDDVMITSKLIDGTYPDYRRVIPQNNSKTVHVDNAALRTAVERVSLVASERGKGVRLSIAGDSIDLYLRDTDGEAQDSVPCEYSGEPVEIGFNSKYLAELLAHMPAGDVAIHLEDGGSPTVFKSASGAAFLAVLMPMRVG